MVTAEMKKGRYVYYHCTGYKGKCSLPYFREEELGDRLGQVLRDIHIPDDVLGPLQKALMESNASGEAKKQQEHERLGKRLGAGRRRSDQIYLDKLDGKVAEEFWLQKTQEWQQEEQQTMLAMRGLEEGKPDRTLDGVRILELANKAYSLHIRQNHAERAKLLRIPGQGGHDSEIIPVSIPK